MKLTVGDIRFSESGYASATVGVGTGTFPFLLFSICKMDVSVPVVDGKEIKDYDEDLRNKAREVITKIYKEIVCGENDVGEQSTMLIQAANSNSIQMMQASIDELKDQITRLQEEKRLEKTKGHISGLSQDSDGSLVMRDVDGSVRVRMNAEKQTDSAINIKVGFPMIESTIDKMEMKNKSDNGKERDFYGLDVSYKKTLNSDIIIRGLVDVEKNIKEPTIHLLYSEDYDEQSSFSEFRSRAEKYARDVYRKIKASD